MADMFKQHFSSSSFEKHNTDIRQFLFLSQSFSPFTMKPPAHILIGLRPLFPGPDQRIFNPVVRLCLSLCMSFQQTPAALCFRTERPVEPVPRRFCYRLPELHPSAFRLDFPAVRRQPAAYFFQYSLVDNGWQIRCIEPCFPEAAAYSGFPPVPIAKDQGIQFVSQRIDSHLFIWTSA